LKEQEMPVELLLSEGIWKNRWFNGTWVEGESCSAVTDKASGEELSKIGLATPDLAPVPCSS
jgi:hypothetical protein